ncbi:MAG: hypothetical protein QXG78_02120 [Candidatus Methanomethyliaceae archaeon]
MISLVFAQAIRFRGEIGCAQQEGINYFICKLIGVINIFYWIGMVSGIGILMYSGFKYMVNPGKGFKEEVPLIIVGLVLIIASFSIQAILISFFK